ncbi:hypothetical protein F4804DRAFT_310615 [Jackrogersella minutella]|nr:hypothetical protein F4804DRAFT_310615 [Jackrogersella minutella]
MDFLFFFSAEMIGYRFLTAGIVSWSLRGRSGMHPKCEGLPLDALDSHFGLHVASAPCFDDREGRCSRLLIPGEAAVVRSWSSPFSATSFLQLLVRLSRGGVVPESVGPRSWQRRPAVLFVTFRCQVRRPSYRGLRAMPGLGPAEIFDAISYLPGSGFLLLGGVLVFSGFRDMVLLFLLSFLGRYAVV